MGARLLADIGDDEILTITKHFKRKITVPAYDCIGGNMEYKTKVKGFDNLYLILQNLSKQATWLWWGLLQVRDRNTNMCIFTAKDNIEAKKITNAYKELSELNLIKRVSRQHYMINPTAYLPELNQFEIVSTKWNNLVEIKEQ